MNLIQRNLGLTATITITAILACISVFQFPTLETAAYASVAAMLICASAASGIQWHRQNRFNENRRLAMQSVEDFCTSLDFIEKDLPFTRYQRFQFSRATGQALHLSDSLRDWIILVHLRHDRQSIAHEGLQLKDVPSFVDNIMSQVHEAYKFVREGGSSKAPRILDPAWFDETEICGEEVLLFPTSRQSRARTLGTEAHKRLSTEYPKLRSSVTLPESASKATDVTTSATALSAQASEDPRPAADFSDSFRATVSAEQVLLIEERPKFIIDPELLRNSSVLIFDQNKRRKRA